MTEPSSLTSTLYKLMQRAIQSAGGWIGFDRFMALALYAPGLGYYANSGAKFGTMPEGVKGEGSDFRDSAGTQHRCSGRPWPPRWARRWSETGTDEVWEFGAGSGAHWRCSCSTLWVTR
jgi:SAM-dependent MidA family methyltransferase